MLVKYKKFFFLFLFFGPNPGSAKIEHKKKSWRMADSLSLDRQVLNKKNKWFLKKEGCLRENLPHLKKIKNKMAGVWKIHWKNGLFSRCFLGQ